MKEVTRQVWLPGGGFAGFLLCPKGLGGRGPFRLVSEFYRVVALPYVSREPEGSDVASKSESGLSFPLAQWLDS